MSSVAKLTKWTDPDTVGLADLTFPDDPISKALTDADQDKTYQITFWQWTHQWHNLKKSYINITDINDDPAV